jgi:hypothetical protein
MAIFPKGARTLKGPAITTAMGRYKLEACTLSTLIKNGKGMSPAADKCRENMDEYWLQCTEEQQEILSKYVDDLYQGRDINI